MGFLPQVVMDISCSSWQNCRYDLAKSSHKAILMQV